MGLIAVKPSLLEKLVAWEAPTTRSRAAATVASSTTTDIPLGTPVYRAASAGPIVGKQAWSLIPTTFPTGDIYVGLTMADIPKWIWRCCLRTPRSKSTASTGAP